jgi:hypothetical protein
MVSDNKLELVIDVDINNGNASIKSDNTDLSSMEQAAWKAAHSLGHEFVESGGGGKG